MRRCTGVISTSWGQACSASCALASCNWGATGLWDTVFFHTAWHPTSHHPPQSTLTTWGVGAAEGWATEAEQTPGSRPGYISSARPGEVAPSGWPQLTLLLALVARFLPETRLLRIRLKDWRSDFLSDFTRERGPSMARESLG